MDAELEQHLAWALNTRSERAHASVRMGRPVYTDAWTLPPHQSDM